MTPDSASSLQLILTMKILAESFCIVLGYERQGIPLFQTVFIITPIFINSPYLIPPPIASKILIAVI